MRLKTINNFNDLCILNEEINDRVAGIFPGAFKPPHAGHYHTALQAAKQCDTLFILMSDTPRQLAKDNSSSEQADWERYKSILPGGKLADKLTNIRVELAQCMRPVLDGKPASASRLRREIAGYAFDHLDFNTFSDNTRSFIPNSLTEEEQVAVAKKMVKHAQDNIVDAYESAEIWGTYINHLTQETGTDIVFEILQGSPVAMSYQVVDTINENNTFDLVKLFVGC